MPEPAMIAIVDDEQSVRRALGRLVKSIGLQAETFCSAEEFLESSADQNPRCLILDLRLPGISGLELQRQLARSEQRLPIIFISAHDDAESRAQALGAGAIAFISKPFRDDLLLDAIHSATADSAPAE